MAHILSRAINCLNPKDGDPCNQCEICREILAGSCVDVLEIDAASNNSVDNVRAIRDEVIYAPTKARRKVYIIDEVHMLSTGAFNALLKTLEEPPEHVVFILATTEPHKLPATILSRCQRFDFRRISHDSIVKQLDKIATAGGTVLNEDAARLIARMSDGAMRDAISLLDQCISLGSGNITYDNVLSVVGIVNDTFMAEFVESMLKKNVAAILGNIGRLVSDGRDIAHFVSDLVIYFRNILICNVTNGQCDNLIEVPLAVMENMKMQAGSISRDGAAYLVKELSSLERDLKWAANPRVLLEVSLIKLCGSNSMDDKSMGDGSILDRLAALESKLDNSTLINQNVHTGQVFAESKPQAVQAAAPVNNHNGSGTSAASGITAANQASSHIPERSTIPVASPKPAKPGTREAAKPAQAAAEFQQWPKIMSYMKSMGRMKIHSFLLNAKAILLDDNDIGLVFGSRDSFTKTLVSKPEHIELIEEAALKVTGKEYKVKCLDEENFNKAATAKAATAKAAADGDDELMKKARSIADKTGLPLEIIDE